MIVLLHAEVLAIRQASEKLGGWRLVDCGFICNYGAMYNV